MGKALIAHHQLSVTGVVRVAEVRFAVALPNGDVLVPGCPLPKRVTTGVRPKVRKGR